MQIHVRSEHLSNTFYFSFSDIETSDWTTIKNTLSSSDSWSICRIGDYFVRRSQNKRRHQQNEKDEQVFNSPHNDNDIEDDSMMTNNDSNSENSTEEYDMLDDIYGDQTLFRIMPQPYDSFHVRYNENMRYQPILGCGQ